jgi:lipopolysaccharide cholinephosphotransferase
MAATLEFIDREKSLENMILAQKILRKYGIEPFLHYGTCLGAVREKDFIPHDDDADMGIYGRDKAKFKEAFPELETNGFTVKFIRDGGTTMTDDASDESQNYRMYKLSRNGQELDFFMAFEKRYFFFIRRWDIDGRVSIAARFLDTLDTISFLDHDFACPHDTIGFLRTLYGKTWNIPIRNTTSRIGWLTRIKKLKNPFKVFFYAKRFMSTLSRKRQAEKEFRKEQH